MFVLKSTHARVVAAHRAELATIVRLSDTIRHLQTKVHQLEAEAAKVSKRGARGRFVKRIDRVPTHVSSPEA